MNKEYTPKQRAFLAAIGLYLENIKKLFATFDLDFKIEIKPIEKINEEK